MRLRIDITTRALSIPWEDVLRPGRGLIYHLLDHADPTLGSQLHQSGWGPHGMLPIGHSAPQFPKARRRRGTYTTDGPGHLEVGSPLPGLIERLADVVRSRPILDWAGTALHVHRVSVQAPPAFADGHAEFRTATPVVLKALRYPNNHLGQRKGKDVLPHEHGFTAAFHRNLQRKAETFDLDPHITIDGTPWVGAKRGFATHTSQHTGRRTGAPITTTLHTTPDTLKTLWSWGLGQANINGFGWIKN